jgi:GTP-binding protein Era
MVEIGEQDLKDEAFFNKIIHSKIPVFYCWIKLTIQEQLEEQVAFWTEKVPNAERFIHISFKEF